MTITDTYPPALALRPTDEQLEDFVDDFCLEPADRRALLWMFLGPDGVPVGPPLAFGGLPVEPSSESADLVATRIVEIAEGLAAASVLLVWQNDDESLSAHVDDQRWAAAVLSRLRPDDLVVHPPVRRTPSDVRRLVLVG